MRKNLSADFLGELLAAPLLAVLATRRDDGTTLLSPVWHEWRDGGFTVIIEADDVKSRHVRRDPRVTLLVAEQVPPYRSFEVRGTAMQSRPPDLPAILTRIATRYLGAERGREYATDMDWEGEVLRIVPGHTRGWDYCDEAG